MTRSMTGFGKAAGECDGLAITCELSSVNHRYLDMVVRLPGEWSALEASVKQAVRRRLSRGKVTVTVNRRRGSVNGQHVQFDEELARQYVEVSQTLGQILGQSASISLDVLAQMDGVLYREEPEADLEALEPVTLGILEAAMKKADAMRLAEGDVLAKDVGCRVEQIRESLALVEACLPELNAAHEERLRSKIADLSADVSMTEERIAIEVALLAEKADVTEEVVRLKSHLDQMNEVLAADGPVGRKMDFLSQELQREVNTLGVKTRNADVIGHVLTMKAEVEKIREQVQNIE